MPIGPHDRNDDFLTHDPPELQRLHGQANDREITLSTGTILGIFFALALLCAVVFGMGYTLGRRSSQTLAAADQGSTDSGSFGNKPSPQSLAMQPAASFPPAAPATSTESAVTVPTSAPTPAPITTPAEPKPAPPPAHVAPAAASVQPPAPIVSGSQSSIVQIAAVSRQEDADILLTALRKKGYAVSGRSESQDKLIHIQVGPFSNRKEADAMRQRLLGDGYNAIVK
ncbi:MAG TPA: SPOR domain-containing protein [Acidobacteriaceae bacterium]